MNSRAAAPWHDERGSVLLVAMLFATAIALALTSFLQLGRTSLKVAHRTYFASDASNLAEAGVEEALFCFERMEDGVAAATAWSEWNLSGSTATRTLPTFNRDQNGVAVVKVHVTGYDGSVAVPVVFSQAVVTPFDGGRPLVKTVRVQLSRTITTPSYGVLARQQLTLAGLTFINSFNSNPLGSPVGPYLAYNPTLAASNVAVFVESGSVSIASGQIHGNLHLGPGVSAPPASKVTGTIHSNQTTTFALPTFPTAAGVSRSYDLGTNVPALLPAGGHLPASDGRYYYFCRNTTIRNLNIAPGAEVSLIGTGTNMAENPAIPATASLQVYIDGVVTLSSSRDINDGGWAGALQIFSTSSGTFQIGNNCRLVAVVHAPNASLVGTSNSANGRIVGSFVFRTISLSGEMDIHYDESLGTAGSGGTGFAVTQWLELQSAADRAAVPGLTGNFLR